MASKDPTFIGGTSIGGAVPPGLKGLQLGALMPGGFWSIRKAEASPAFEEAKDPRAKSPSESAENLDDKFADDVPAYAFDEPEEAKIGWELSGPGVQSGWIHHAPLNFLWIPDTDVEKAAFDKYLNDLGIDPTKLIPVEPVKGIIKRQLQADAPPPTGPYDLEKEIVWRVLKNAIRYLVFDSVAAFKLHVQLRMRIVETTKARKPFYYGQYKRRPSGWREKRFDIYDGLKAAVDQWWTPAPALTEEEAKQGLPSHWTCGCLRGAELMMIQGISRGLPVGAFNAFGDFKGGTANLTDDVLDVYAPAPKT